MKSPEVSSGSILIYLDGPNLMEMSELGHLCDGFTYNPNLFRALGVENYFDHCKLLSQKEKIKPISFDVIADDHHEMIRQAHLLSELGQNIWVKIPVTFCNGKSTKKVIFELQNSRIKVNITAVFSLKQMQDIADSLNEDISIISVFAGRIYDLGLDAKKILLEMVNWNSKNLCSKILWARPRMIFDLISANQIGCDIITIPPNIFTKKNLWGKHPEEYSKETIQMFFNDALRSKYSF